jgi:chromate transport protein ChrA
MSTNNTHSVNLSREFAMARFAEPHLAAAPHDSTNSSPLLIGNMGSAMDGSRTLAGMLVAAAMAALLVVADQVIETWTDGHLLAGWVALWTVAFAALALMAAPLRHMVAFAAGGVARYFSAWREQRSEERMWELASRDPRVMEEIRAAMARQAV